MKTPLDTSNNTRTKNELDIRAVLSFLAQELSKGVDDLTNDLRSAESRYMDVMSARVAAQAELSTKRLQYLHPKDKEMTDMDRKIYLDANTCEYQAEYELLAGIEKALEQRITVIQTLLAK